MALYPMIFEPKFVEKMWGGTKLQSVLHKPVPTGKVIGESWELYDFPPGVVDGSTEWVSAKLSNGPLAGMTLHELVQKFGKQLHGNVALAGDGEQFPILIKFLDAAQDLSVQVHPPQSYADAHPGAHLKNECWYVVDSDPAARILKDLVPGVTRDSFEQSIAAGTCEQLIESISVKANDFHYLASGTVHALGGGILAAEVQTPSDTTYRVYDFDRIEPATGKKRQLHVAQALDCIDFSGDVTAEQPRSHVASYFTTVTRLIAAPQFTVEKVRMTEGFQQALPYDQPVVWMMLEGAAEISVSGLAEPVKIGRGQTVLFPAALEKPLLKTLKDCVWLEVTFPTA